MKKKYAMISLTIVLVISISIITLLASRSTSHKPREIEAYDKYSIQMNIKSKKGTKSESAMISAAFDGTSMEISSNKDLPTAYILADELFYLNFDECHVFKLKKSYKDLEKMISNTKDADVVKTEDNTTYYSKVLNPEELDELLASIFINKKAQSSSVATYTVLENRVVNFNITAYTEDDSVITINLKFKRQDPNFKINLPSRNKKIVADKENIYEIVK